MNKGNGGYTVVCANGFGIQPLPSADISARMALANFDANADRGTCSILFAHDRVPLAKADRIIINGWGGSMAETIL
jgi:hypothetical protein